MAVFLAIDRNIVVLNPLNLRSHPVHSAICAGNTYGSEASEGYNMVQYSTLRSCSLQGTMS